MSISFNSSVCLYIILRDVTATKTVWEPSICWTPCDATYNRGVDNFGRKRYTHEADILERNWYNFWTAGRNSYFPVLLPVLP
jgi:hypothetical protein